MNRIWGYAGLMLIACAPVFAQSEAEMRQAPGTWRGPATRPIDPAFREKFVQIERIARLAPEARSARLNELYEIAQPLLNAFVIESILSTGPPARLLSPDRTRGPGRDELTLLWAAELDEAAKTMSPEQVADAIQANHGLIILRVASRRRAMNIFQQNRPQLAALLESHITGPDIEAARRAIGVVGDFQLSEFTEKFMQLYLANGPLADAARNSLTWIPSDPALAKKLIEEVEKDPQTLKRHSMLIAVFLRRQPVDERLLKYLDSPDAEMRFAAANALTETDDETMLVLAPKLLEDADSRVRDVGVRIALRAQPAGYQLVRPALIKLLSWPDMQTRIDAAIKLASQQDPHAGPVVLQCYLQTDLDPRYRTRLVTAMRSLLGAGLRITVSEWGSNQQIISGLEEWIRANPVR